LLVTRQKDNGKYERVGGPHSTEDEARVEGERLREQDSTVIDYRVTTHWERMREPLTMRMLGEDFTLQRVKWIWLLCMLRPTSKGEKRDRDDLVEQIRSLLRSPVTLAGEEEPNEASH
jgi:hypothetical protein